jgi:hypothetical protein
MQWRGTFKGKHLLSGTVMLAVLGALILGPGCSREADLRFETYYQAVFLDNGQVFIGKLEQAGSHYPLLRDVFYVQRQVEGDKKEVKNVLIKRGSEWHRPDYMRLNAQHIVLIEPVNPESRMAQLIKETKAGRPPETRPMEAKPPETKK